MKYSSQPEPAHSGRRPRLLRRFETLESFRDEYRRNIANGGIFVACDQEFSTRELVDLVLDLAWCDQEVLLEGEVVSRVPAPLSQAGADPGVALQFVGVPPETRERLSELADLPPAPDHAPESRAEKRRKTRVGGSVETQLGELPGRTRDLSHSGVLMAIDGAPLAVGSAVRVTLKHPTTGESRELQGSVVRSSAADEGHSDIAVEFERREGEPEAAEFIESLQAADHARRLGTIGGPIGTLGVPNLVQMFSSCSERGMLLLEREAERASVGFEGGNLVHSKLGPVRGVKALARVFAWTDGTFEFVEELGPSDAAASAIPIYGAVMEALTQLDELARLDLDGLEQHAELELDLASTLDSDDNLGKVEQALISKLSEGVRRVGELLDTLPDPDAEIYASLLALRERGIVRSH